MGTPTCRYDGASITERETNMQPHLLACPRANPPKRRRADQPCVVAARWLFRLPVCLALFCLLCLPDGAPGAYAAGTPTPSPTRASQATPSATPTATVQMADAVLAPSVLSGKVVVLDPGHGGDDPGAVANGVQEKSVTLGVSLALSQLLQQAGATVIMTRTTDITVGPSRENGTGLQMRSDIANQARADVFLSIHANALANADRSGATTYFGQRCGYVSAAQRDPVLIARSYRLATRVQQKVVAVTGEIDRGIDSADYWVLGNTAMPSILVETGFVTNPDEAAKLVIPSYQQLLAQGVLLGLRDYFYHGEDTIPLPPAPANSTVISDDSTFQADITIPDGTAITPGTPFTKTWRLRNTGCTPWLPGYRLAFLSGDRMGGPISVPVTAVYPGSSVNISVPLVGSDRASATGSWQMLDASGTPFGDVVTVKTVASTLAATATPTPTPPPPPPTVRVPPTNDPKNARYFAITGHNIAFGFLSYFDTRGGLDRFGYPRTEEIMENDQRVQYFQRARFEYHPEFAGTRYEVELMLLGDAVTTTRRPFRGVAAFLDSPGHAYFKETGHSTNFAFLDYFRMQGGLDSYGYPISEEMEQRDASGRVLTVQYFQRARLEYHPEFAGTRYAVELGLLGDEYLTSRGWLP